MIGVERIDYVRIPVTDMEQAEHFYGEVLGLAKSPNSPDEDWIEYEVGNATLAVMTPHTHDYEFTQLPPSTIALPRPRSSKRRRRKLESAGLEVGEIWDSGACKGPGSHRSRRQPHPPPPPLRAVPRRDDALMQVERVDFVSFLTQDIPRAKVSIRRPSASRSRPMVRTTWSSSRAR